MNYYCTNLPGEIPKRDVATGITAGSGRATSTVEIAADKNVRLVSRAGKCHN
jgi:hypothetical protein